MSNSTVAKRYALALFQLGKEHLAIGQLERELVVVKEVVQNNQSLMAVLSSPKITKDKKKEILKTAFKGTHQLLINTLMMLVDRDREDYISSLTDEFLALSNDEKGVADAKVYSVRQLTDAEKEALSSTFAAKIGKKSLRIENIVDSNLLGGVKLRIGNTIFDGSLSGKLERLERQLLG